MNNDDDDVENGEVSEQVTRVCVRVCVDGCTFGIPWHFVSGEND